MSKEKKPNTTTGSKGFIRIFHALAAVAVLALVGYFVYINAVSPKPQFPFKLGLDLAGGSHLEYAADTSKIAPSDVANLMDVLRTVIEKRVDAFGVSEPLVQVEHSNFGTASTSERLIVELPGVTDLQAAIKDIGKTPLLEFKLVNPTAASAITASTTSTSTVAVKTASSTATTTMPAFIDTGLTGRYLQSAQLEFQGGTAGQVANTPVVAITFNAAGGKLFQEITSKHVGQQLAIFLDGHLISSPRINEAIAGGKAIISCNFTPQTARDLAQNLSFGALPVPIHLVSTQTIGATLGAQVLHKGIAAGLAGLLLVIAFMALWYRLPGLMAGIALIGYVVMTLALFLLIPVTLTSAGLAGFVLSLGMAVDANVLVFERMKEEYRSGKPSHEAIEVGFQRAWAAIRDGHVTSIISAIILFWFGTSLIKGFALVFGLGVIVSLISALFVTRRLVDALPGRSITDGGLLAWLYNSGFIKTK